MLTLHENGDNADVLVKYYTDSTMLATMSFDIGLL